MIQAKRFLLAALAALLLLGVAGCATTSPRDVALLVTPEMIEACVGERPEEMAVGQHEGIAEIKSQQPQLNVMIVPAGHLLAPDAAVSARMSRGIWKIVYTYFFRYCFTYTDRQNDVDIGMAVDWLLEEAPTSFPNIGRQAIYYRSPMGFGRDRLEFSTNDGKFDVRIIGSGNTLTFSESMVDIKQLARALSDQYDATYR